MNTSAARADMTERILTPGTPAAIYVWLVPSEHVQEQPGSWRIRKWDTAPFPEANYTLSASSETGTNMQPMDFICTDARDERDRCDEQCDACKKIASHPLVDGDLATQRAIADRCASSARAAIVEQCAQVADAYGNEDIARPIRAEGAGRVIDADAIADKLVEDWIVADKMPQMAWGFREFAAEAIRRAFSDGKADKECTYPNCLEPRCESLGTPKTPFKFEPCRPSCDPGATIDSGSEVRKPK